MVGKELAALLQRQPRRKEQGLVPVLLLPLAQAGADVSRAAQRLAIGSRSSLEQVPLADHRLVADLDQAPGGGGVLAGDQEAGIGGTEFVDDGSDGLVLLGVDGAGAGVLAALAGVTRLTNRRRAAACSEAWDMREDLVGALGHRPVDAAGLTIGVEGEALALATEPGLLERVLQQRQLAEVVADLVQQRLQERRVDGEADRLRPVCGWRRPSPRGSADRD